VPALQAAIYENRPKSSRLLDRLPQADPQRLPAGVYENAVTGKTGSGAGTAEEGHLMTLKVSGVPEAR